MVDEERKRSITTRIPVSAIIERDNIYQRDEVTWIA